MSRIDDLIAEQCPDGVEFKALGEVGTWYGGGTPSKYRPEYWRGGSIPWLSPKDMGKPIVTTTVDYITEAAVAGSATKVVPAASVALVVRSSILDRLLPTALVPIPIALNQDMKAVVTHDHVLPRYLAHLLRSLGPQLLQTTRKTGGSVASIDVPRLLSTKIPVPPLVVQGEIARTLGRWDALETDLDAEIELRGRLRAELGRRLIETSVRQTRAHGGLERVRLGEIAAQFVEPVRVEPDQTYVNLGVRWYGEGVFAREARLGSSIKGSTLYKVKPGQLIFNRMFVTEGSFAVIPESLADGVVSSEFPVYDLDDSRVLPDWLMLYLLDEYTLKRIEAETTGTERGSMKSRRRWKEQQFEAFEISLPPIEIQRGTARALGADAQLATALREEQAARRKQYEYYRDRLLAFEEAS